MPATTHNPTTGKQTPRGRWRYIIHLLTGTLLLMGVGFYNGYALVYWDTASYLHAGFEYIVPKDRSIVYGLFINYISFGSSVWYLLFVQNLLAAFALLELVRLFAGPTFRSWIYYLVTALLCLLTGIAWNSNQLMPDFLSPLLFLFVFLSLFDKNVSAGKLVLYSLLLVFCCVCHFSHLLIGLVTVVLISIYCYWRRKRDGAAPVKRAALVLVVLGSGFLVLPFFNYCIDGRFTLSKSTHQFVVGHLVENGVMADFLQKHCDRPEFVNTALCQCKDQLPTDLTTFLWHRKACFENAGGWTDSKGELAFFSKEILGRPSYFLLNLEKTFISAGVQVFRHRIGPDIIPNREDSQNFAQVKWRFSHEINQYLHSRQNSGLLNNDFFYLLNACNAVLNYASALFVLLLIASSLWQHISPLSRRMVIFVLFALFINALVAATFNAPNDRYQARVMWLLPFAVILVLISDFRSILNFLKGKRDQATRPGLSPRNDFQPL